MDMTVLSDIVLPIVFIVVGVLLAWLIVEAVKFLRRTAAAVEAMRAQVTPLVEDARAMTESLKPAVDKVDPLVERVSLAVDAANLEIMRLDGILENVNRITETTASAASAVDTVANTPLKLVNTATEKLRDAFAARKASQESEALAAAGEAAAEHAEAAVGKDAASEASAPRVSQASHVGEDRAAALDADREAEQYFTYGAAKEQAVADE